ncbi:MAG: NUDIX domain-containing protein [Schleiferiaceae bacterium]|nr:NUDIX domain-containing protein [Schleiferiaceae bacterium]
MDVYQKNIDLVSTKPHSVNPNLSVDCVVFGFDNENLNVLLIQQKKIGDIPQQIALPGDLVLEDESLDAAAERVLFELTGLKGIFLKQFYTFGDPNRVKNIKDLAWLQSYRKQPQARVVTVGYFALVKMDDFQPEASSFAETVFWQEVQKVPQSLAFDHNEIITTALESLRQDFEAQRIGFELLPEKFTLNQIQVLYEAILDKKLDKRNFRKKILKENLLQPTNEKQKNVLHKPAMLYEFNPA